MTARRAVTAAPAAVYGHPKPRIAPPVPARHGLASFVETAKGMDIELMPWQQEAARYLTAIGPDGRHLYTEVAVVVARQQGKTTLMKPLIVGALRSGKRVMHIAQSRELPRVMFGVIAQALEPELFLKRRGKGGNMQTIWPRFGAGSEEIVLANGGSYRIAAGKTGGARGWTNDLVIIDELREVTSWTVIEAAQPTLRMSDDGQMIYLSNAGHEDSVVLNAVRARRDEDPHLAYLEWSASPDRRADDVAGWAEANPAIGHYRSVLPDLERAYLSAKLSGNMAGFETESLCRWVPTMRQPLVDPGSWVALRGELGDPSMPYMGVALDPSGTRASAALAWRMPDERIAVRSLLEATGSPINADELATDLKDIALSQGVFGTGFDPLTDAHLARFIGKKAEPISGNKWANASARFAAAVGSGTLVWDDADAVTDDLTWTTRKPHDESGSFQAVRADDDRPITAALAAIRAVWLASGAPRGEARVW